MGHISFIRSQVTSSALERRRLPPEGSDEELELLLLLLSAPLPLASLSLSLLLELELLLEELLELLLTRRRL
jgi:hypothetical protein